MARVASISAFTGRSTRQRESRRVASWQTMSSRTFCARAMGVNSKAGLSGSSSRVLKAISTLLKKQLRRINREGNH